MVPGHCLCAGFLESCNFFVLRPIQVKFHIRTRLIESFPTTLWLSWFAEGKWRFTPVHTLRQLKRNEALFPPLLIGLADRNGPKNLTRQIFSAFVKFGGNPCRDVDTRNFSKFSYKNLRAVIFSSFERRNFLVLRPVPLKIAYFNSANRQLSIDVRPKELQ